MTVPFDTSLSFFTHRWDRLIFPLPRATHSHRDAHEFRGRREARAKTRRLHYYTMKRENRASERKRDGQTDRPRGRGNGNVPLQIRASVIRKKIASADSLADVSMLSAPATFHRATAEDLRSTSRNER